MCISLQSDNFNIYLGTIKEFDFIIPAGGKGTSQGRRDKQFGHAVQAVGDGLSEPKNPKVTRLLHLYRTRW